MRYLQKVSNGLAVIERVFAQFSIVAMVAIMLVVVTDVVLRYFFSRPIFFAYDLISMYLVVVLFFFVISHTLHNHGHISIDLFQRFLPMRVRHVGEGLCYAAGAVVFALVAWLLSERTHTALVRGQVTDTTIPWPIWLSILPAALGCWLFTLRCAYRAIAHIASGIVGRVLVELPPPPITDIPGAAPTGEGR
ncbi:MAG: TRAP transporter small permease [Roseovarius sp.]|nr:TRAP transporter small permease [Roseovarius sp.]